MTKIWTPRENKGFTLMEVMATVAIISILATISIPLYNSMKMRVYRVSAKVLLSGIYQAERIFHAEYNSYTTRFDAIGFRPDGRVHWFVGFSPAVDFAPPPEALQGDPLCNAICEPVENCPYYLANPTFQCSTAAMDSNWDDGLPGFATQNTFLVGAHLHPELGNDALAETMVINERRQVIHFPDRGGH